jgi:hypothetical protein
LLPLNARGFEVLVTIDGSLRYQPNLASRMIAIVVLGTTSWPRIKGASEVVVAAIAAAASGTYAEIAIP